MGHKETLQAYNTRLDNNNTALTSLKNTIQTLQPAKKVVTQSKSITITENTTTTLTPDSGYTGMDEVEITTNVSGSAPTVGVAFSDWDNDGYPHTAQYGGKSTVGAYYFGTQTTSGSYGLTSRLETVTLSNDVTQLGNYTFNLCKQLTSVIAPSVTVVGNGAFSGDIALQSFPTFSSSGVSLGTNVFQDCLALNFSTIPSNVISIGATCFQGCTGLHLTEIPTTVSSVGNSAFSGCTGIQQITLHNTTTFGTSVFYNCTGLTTVNLDGATFNFPSNFFQNCSNLQTIDTTKLVVVPQYGFSGCTNLSVTQFHNTTELSVYGAKVFSNCKKIYQLSFPILKGIVPNAQQYATFSGCNIRAIWLGSAITTKGLNQHSFRSASELRRIFFDLPRATVEAMPQYANKFSGNTVHSTCEIICNDDSGWLTLAQFDAIDWENYSF